MNQEALLESDLAIVGNADIDVFLNGTKLATLSDAKNASFPVQFREGGNFIVLAGSVRSRGPHTGVRALVRLKGARIDTSLVWKISTLPEFVRQQTWLDQNSDRDDWESPVVVYKKVPDYIEYRDDHWIDALRLFYGWTSRSPGDGSLKKRYRPRSMSWSIAALNCMSMERSPVPDRTTCIGSPFPTSTEDGPRS
jgi:hypothetical protein